MRLLEEFWYGNIEPTEYDTNACKEYNEVLRLITRNEEKLQAMPISRKDTRMFVRHFLAGAAEVEVDKQGRALIPSKLREFAELTKDVVLVGAAGHIEIWSQERWDALEEEAEESMEDIAERMDDLGL